MTDKTTINIVVVFVGIAMLACIGGIIWLSADSSAIPDVLQTTTATLVGGFIGMLVSTRSGGQAAPVQVVNAPNNPVPVDAQPDAPVAPVPAAGYPATLAAPLAPEDHEQL